MKVASRYLHMTFFDVKDLILVVNPSYVISSRAENLENDLILSQWHPKVQIEDRFNMKRPLITNTRTIDELRENSNRKLPTDQLPLKNGDKQEIFYCL